MNIASCMSSDVSLTAPDATIQQAARTMKEIDAGILPVGDNDRIVGMITDRDIAVRAVAAGLGPETTVRQVMTDEVCYCFEDEDISDVALQMADLQVRRLPVLSREKRLVGIIALGDIVQSSGIDGTTSVQALAGITQPSDQHNQASA
jgi:CBS domain-containing protein